LPWPTLLRQLQSGQLCSKADAGRSRSVWLPTGQPHRKPIGIGPGAYGLAGRDASDTRRRGTSPVTRTVVRLRVVDTPSAFTNGALIYSLAENPHESHPASVRCASSFIDDNADGDGSAADVAAAFYATIGAIPGIPPASGHRADGVP
jgi:hypothetical protein